MKGMIFCAGLGTRLKPLTDTMPKALVPLAGKPLLQWQVEKLRDAGITDIIVNVHHFPDQIIDTIRRNNGWGCNILISDERDQLLDTGGGLKKAINHSPFALRHSPLLACNVDILSNLNLRAFIDSYDPSLVLFTVDNVNTYVVFLVQVLCQVLRTIDRAVLPARTSEGHLQVRELTLNIPLHMMINECIDGVQEGQNLTVFLQKIDDGLIQTGHLLVFFVPTRVVSRTAVEDITASVSGFIYGKSLLKREGVNHY